MHLDKISDLLFSSFLGGHSAMANFSSRQSLHDLPPLNGGALAQIDHLILKCLLDFFNFQIYLERAVSFFPISACLKVYVCLLYLCLNGGSVDPM